MIDNKLTRRDMDEFNSITTSATPRPAPAAAAPVRMPARPMLPGTSTSAGPTSPVGAMSPATPAPALRPPPRPAAAPVITAASGGPPARTAAIPPPPAPSRPLPSVGQMVGQGLRGDFDRQASMIDTARNNRDRLFRAVGNFAGDVRAGFTGQPNVQFVDRPPAASAGARQASLNRGDLTSRPAAAAAPAGGAALSRPKPQYMPNMITRPGQTTADEGASSINGRPLGYGAEINGVRVFSDGSGRIPATMSVGDLAQLERGDRLTTYAAGTAPAIGAGGAVAVTPGRPAAPAAPPAAGYPGGVARPSPAATTAAGAPAAQPSAPALYMPQRPAMAAPAGGPNPLELQRYAASDAASIAGGDIRSPLGAVSRNLQSQMQFGSRPQRAAAAQQLEGLQAGVGQGYGGVMDAQVRGGAEQLRAATELERAGIESAGRINEARISRPRLQSDRITLEDGRIAIMGEDGASRIALGPDGKPLRTTLPKQGQLAPADRLKTIRDIAIAAANNGPLTPEILEQARQFVDGQNARPSLDEFLPAARQQNPGVSDDELRAYYDKTYGG